MAESQEPYPYPPDTLLEIESQLSIKRFGTYMLKSGYNREHAIQLYLYNARLAKAVLFPLHILEVVLRNGIDGILTERYDTDWHKSLAFRNILSPPGNNSLQKATSRFPKQPKKDDIISQLSLDFWSNLFRPEYDRHLWQTKMPALFPNQNITRAAFESDIWRYLIKTISLPIFFPSRTTALLILRTIPSKHSCTHREARNNS